MPNIELLKKKISDSGMTIVFICENARILRETFYNRLAGKGEFTASEIVNLTKVLRLSKKERDDIFFNQKVN